MTVKELQAKLTALVACGQITDATPVLAPADPPYCDADGGFRQSAPGKDITLAVSPSSIIVAAVR